MESEAYQLGKQIGVIAIPVAIGYIIWNSWGKKEEDKFKEQDK